MNKLRNTVLAAIALVLSAAIYFGFQTQVNGTSLEMQAQQSIPLDVALSNGKPTLTEFYADWCSSCQAMAKEMAQLKQVYGSRVNFVMLNVDNSKWLPEVLRYRVDGIPHFVFMDSTGVAIADAIGEQPTPILDADLDALASNLPLPYANPTGQTSKFATKLAPVDSTDPRRHGA